MIWKGKHLEPTDKGAEEEVEEEHQAPYNVLMKLIEACDLDHALVMARKKKVSTFTWPWPTRWWM